MSTILETELTVDELGWGYNGPGIFNPGPDPMKDREAADILNAIHPAPDTRTRNRDSMSGRQVKAEVDSAEYDALSADKKAQFLALTASDDLDPFGLDVNVIKDIFGPASATVAALATARIETVGRGVELGLGQVGEGDVWDVRNGN